MSGISALHLLEEAVRPALNELGDPWNGVAAEQLLMGTAAVESGLVYLRQLPRADGRVGPAKGLFQMEPFTFDDLLRRLNLERFEHLRNCVVFQATTQEPDASEMCWNLRFAAAMCRMKYRDAKPKLPEPWDIVGFEDYHKRFYNSAIGATRPGEFRRAWDDLIAPSAGRMWP